MTSTEFLLYQSEDGRAHIEVRMVGENVWLSLTQLTELFGRDKSVISRHVKNISDEGEVTQDSIVAVFATVQAEGERPPLHEQQRIAESIQLTEQLLLRTWQQRAAVIRRLIPDECRR